MPLFKRKAAPVEARCVTKDAAEDVAQWCGGLLVTEIDAEDPGKTFVGINVPTHLGIKRASQGDWVVKGSGGEFHAASSETFLDQYEPLDA